MEVTVTKKSSNENTFETKLEDLLEMPFKPEKGKGLILLGEEAGSGIVTSTVQQVTALSTPDGKAQYIVNTKNSTYLIQEK